MLNNINSRGLSKTEKIELLNFLGASIADILTKIGECTGQKTNIHVGTKDLANDVNLYQT